MSWYDATMPFQDDIFHIVSHSPTGDAHTTEAITVRLPIPYLTVWFLSQLCMTNMSAQRRQHHSISL